MREYDPRTLTRLLEEVRGGNTLALDELYPVLEGFCRQQLREHRSLNPGLLTCEVLCELWERLTSKDKSGDIMRGKPQWESRGHFFSYAARIVKNYLLDLARERAKLSRDPIEKFHLSAESLAIRLGRRTYPVLDLEEAAVRLESKFGERGKRMRRVIDLRFFGGLRTAEIAEALGVSERTVKNYWKDARLFLKDVAVVEESDL